MHQKFCSKCGNPLNPDNKFCPQCGAKIIIDSDPPSDQTQLVTPTQQNENNNDNKRPTPQSKTLIWILIVIGAVTIGAVTAILISNSKSSPKFRSTEDTDLTDDADSIASEEEIDSISAIDTLATEEFVEEAEPPALANNSSLLNYSDSYVKDYNLSSSQMIYTKNFTRPDLTAQDLHGRVLVSDFYIDGDLVTSTRFDHNGIISDATNIMQPSYTSRDDKGRISRSSYRGTMANFSYNSKGLLTNIHTDDDVNISLDYDNKGELTTMTEYEDGNYQGSIHLFNYVYDDCKNWTSRSFHATNGHSGTMRRDIYYYPVN